MRGFWPIERAALDAGINDFPAFAAVLKRQLEKAKVTKFENTGGGFFSSVAVANDAPLLSSRSPLDVACAKVDGLEHPMGFLIFVKEGRITLLEGYAFGYEPTTDIDFQRVIFEMKPWSEAQELFG